MRAFHDSRNIRYRAPYGVISSGETVTLVLDVWDAPHARATLRTWVDGEGERTYAMKQMDDRTEGAQTPRRTAEGGAEDAPASYFATLTPDVGGIIWYYFIITDEHGTTKRYGACDGAFGGKGQLRDWEPPSFQLTVHAAASDYGQADASAFADALTGFLRNEASAPKLAETIEALRENRLPESYARIFDSLATMSKKQLFMRLSGAGDFGAAEQAHERIHLDERSAGLAKGRLWCASLVQALMPELPASYGGNAAELWGDIDPDCKTIVENALDLRRALPLFDEGGISCEAANEDVFALWRRTERGRSACLLVNASINDAHDVLVPLEDEAASEIISGYGLPIVSAAEAGDLPRIGAAESYVRVHLYQLGTAVVYFHPAKRLQKPLEPGLGILAHITSLPADDPGTLGETARAFVNWLAHAHVRYWQILPVNPTDEFGSPYAGISAFAGNTQLLEPRDENWPDLASLYPDEYRAFCEREAEWLEPYVCFMATRQKRRRGAVWQNWPKKYRKYDPAIVEETADLRSFAEEFRRDQFAFEHQWRELRAYANKRGIQIVGDMPLYVSADSADVWANPEIFLLEVDGKPRVVAGCPPDRFAVDGQVWGNPVYNWPVLKDSGYDWWLRRLKRAFDLYDVVRLDHFIGFSRYYSIPAGGKAVDGTYHPGPGLDFFNKAHETFGPLPIIAEDLGSITPAVRALDAACGFPGMDVAQFVDGNDPLSGYAPRPEKVAYTGTHDNQTLVGYCLDRYPDNDEQESARAIAEAVAKCSADVRILPLQDVLELDDDARMNTPGTPIGNWMWQARAQDVERATGRLQELVKLAERH